jgi:hypothetical protein
MPELAEPGRGWHRLVLVGLGECLVVAGRECPARRGWEPGELVVVRARVRPRAARVPQVAARVPEKD